MIKVTKDNHVDIWSHAVNNLRRVGYGKDMYSLIVEEELNVLMLELDMKGICIKALPEAEKLHLENIISLPLPIDEVDDFNVEMDLPELESYLACCDSLQ